MNQRGGWLDIEKGRRGWSYFQRLSQNIRRDIFFWNGRLIENQSQFFSVIYYNKEWKRVTYNIYYKRFR